MKHEKIIKRDDGNRVKIEVSVYVPAYEGIVRYYSIVTVSPKGKRNFTQVNAYATEEEIQQVKLELWEKLKPCPPSSTPYHSTA